MWCVYVHGGSTIRGANASLYRWKNRADVRCGTREPCEAATLMPAPTWNGVCVGSRGAGVVWVCRGLARAGVCVCVKGKMAICVGGGVCSVAAVLGNSEITTDVITSVTTCRPPSLPPLFFPPDYRHCRRHCLPFILPLFLFYEARAARCLSAQRVMRHAAVITLLLPLAFAAMLMLLLSRHYVSIIDATLPSLLRLRRCFRHCCHYFVMRHFRLLPPVFSFSSCRFAAAE